jgi:hypothetical protein
MRRRKGIFMKGTVKVLLHFTYSELPIYEPYDVG